MVAILKTTGKNIIVPVFVVFQSDIPSSYWIQTHHSTWRKILLPRMLRTGERINKNSGRVQASTEKGWGQTTTLFSSFSFSFVCLFLPEQVEVRSKVFLRTCFVIMALKTECYPEVLQG